MDTAELKDKVGPAPGRQRTVLGAAAGVLVLGAVVAAVTPSLLRGGAKDFGIDPVASFLLAVAVIVLVCHLLGALMRRLGQPPVIGEITGGLVLGPSALGLLWPTGWHWLFPTAALNTLQMAGQLGLVTFMFLLGCELRFDTLGERGGRRVATIALGSMGLPLVAGLAIAVPAQGLLAGTSPHPTAYVVFFGLAISITALPVLARILVDLRMDSSTAGTLALASAAVGDGTAWAALTVILALTGQSGRDQTVTTVGLAAALVLVTVLCVRPVLAALVTRVDTIAGGQQLLLPVLAAGAIGYAATTQLIGLHAVIGAFLFGTAIPRNSPTIERMQRQLRGFTVRLPLFFAGIGLSTSIGAFGGSTATWLLFSLIMVVATAAKFLGAGGGALLAGLSARDALSIGTLMNCRGVTELIVASIGYQHHLINALGLTVLVLMALVTTALTGPLMRVLLNKSPAV